jgi:hypothetical protein
MQNWRVKQPKQSSFWWPYLYHALKYFPGKWPLACEFRLKLLSHVFIIMLIKYSKSAKSKVETAHSQINHSLVSQIKMISGYNNLDSTWRRWVQDCLTGIHDICLTCRVHGWGDFNLSNNKLELVPNEIIYKQICLFFFLVIMIFFLLALYLN